MSFPKNEKLGRIVGRAKILDRKAAAQRGIFAQTKKKAPLLRAMLV
ncbi:MAG: hypothetical protein M3521_09095 [Acidobacteriota bacterium]|nr:hypothetical protein [Acidobacteriota bacterium]